MSLSRKEKIVIFAVILFVCVIVVGSGIYEKNNRNQRRRTVFLRIHSRRLIQALISRAVIMPMTRWL